MTRHDEVRQVLHENGFKFEDGRTALDMTDEEVEKFVRIFIAKMAEISRQFQAAFQPLFVNISKATQSLTNLGALLEESERLKS